MTRLTDAGAIIPPASPGFYHRPRGIDLIDFVVGRILVRLDADMKVCPQWQGGDTKPGFPAILIVAGIDIVLFGAAGAFEGRPFVAPVATLRARARDVLGAMTAPHESPAGEAGRKENGC